MNYSQVFEMAQARIANGLRDNQAAQEAAARSIAQAKQKHHDSTRAAEANFERSSSHASKLLADVKASYSGASDIIRRAHIPEDKASATEEGNRRSIQPNSGLDQAWQVSNDALQFMQSLYRELERVREEQHREQAARQRTLIMISASIVVGIIGLLLFINHSAEKQRQADIMATAVVVANTAATHVADEQATQVSIAAKQTAVAAEQATQAAIIAQQTLMAFPPATRVIVAAEQIAWTSVTSNADWIPVQHEFDGMIMVLVPSGCFDMGKDGRGGRQCFDEPFWIGKYEVTNGQYSRFISEGGYSNRNYWTETGWAWRQQRNVVQPRFWTNNRYNGFSQPVVGVSWYEAFAYANWHGMKLCTEAQWEYAARGPDGLAYPWGNEFVADNVIRVNLGDPVEVGMRHGGASWVGALDMSDNVSEWVSSHYEPYPYNARDGRESIDSDALRMTRGGNIRSSQEYMRTTQRYDHGLSTFLSSPETPHELRGVRVCGSALK